jgi:hypothetical protein
MQRRRSTIPCVVGGVLLVDTDDVHPVGVALNRPTVIWNDRSFRSAS